MRRADFRFINQYVLPPIKTYVLLWQGQRFFYIIFSVFLCLLGLSNLSFAMPSTTLAIDLSLNSDTTDCQAWHIRETVECDETGTGSVCVPFPIEQIDNYIIMVNDTPFTGGATSCVEQGSIDATHLSGFAIGEYQLLLTLVGAECPDTVSLSVNYPEMLLDTLALMIPINEQSSHCFDDEIGDLTRHTLEEICQEKRNEIVNFELDRSNFCINYQGLALGQDTACVRLCDARYQCSLTTIVVDVFEGDDSNPPNSNSGPVVADVVTSTIVTEKVKIEIPPSDSETVIDIVKEPSIGKIRIDDENGKLVYTPNDDDCGAIDEIIYTIKTPVSLDTANVYIDVLCEELTVFNGLSPNNDGTNDNLIILGIDRFPDNIVYVFDGNGNSVFTQKGYTNDNPWDGTKSGVPLPEGTYYYVVLLENGKQYSGYLQIKY